MESKRKINLKRHTMPLASKKYLFRIVAYIVLLSVLIWLVYYLKDSSTTSDVMKDVTEIDNIQISE